MSRKRVRIAAWVLGVAAVVATSAWAKRFNDRNEAKLALMEAAANAEHMDPDAAARAYRQALKIDPKYLPARTGLADLYSSQSREKALAEHRRGIAADPRNPGAYYALARAFCEYRRYPEAIKALERAVALAPRATHLHLLLAHTYRWNGDLDKAREQFMIIQKLDPDSRAAATGLRALERQARSAPAPRSPARGAGR